MDWDGCSLHRFRDLLGSASNGSSGSCFLFSYVVARGWFEQDQGNFLKSKVIMASLGECHESCLSEAVKVSPTSDWLQPFSDPAAWGDRSPGDEQQTEMRSMSWICK